MAWGTFLTGGWGDPSERFWGFCSHTGRVTPSHKATRKESLPLDPGGTSEAICPLLRFPQGAEEAGRS